MTTSIVKWVTGLLYLWTGLTSSAQATGEFSGLRVRAASAPPAPLISRQRLLQRSPIQQVSLSPDGSYLAYRLKKNRHHELWRYSVVDQTYMKLLSTKRLGHLQWAADSQHVYYSDSRHLFAVPLSKANAGVQFFDVSDANSEFLGPDKHVADVLWVNRYKPGSKKHQLLRVHRTGEAEVVYESPHALGGILTDAGGNLAVVKEQIGLDMQISKVDGYSTEPLIRCIAMDPCRLHSWSPASNELVVSAYFDQDLLSLFAINTANGAKRLLHQDPQGRFDIHDVLLGADNKPSLATYEDDYVSHYGLNQMTSEVLVAIQSEIASELMLIDHDKRQRRWLITDAAPLNAVAHYHLYDVEQKRWHTPLAHLFQASLAKEELAPRKGFWYPASDGALLQGYLTLPRGKKHSDVPLIVTPHGGPWNRSKGGFNRHSQFLANRGYAVFEPNFRSSTGFGRNYMLGANRDFGWGRVHQDMLDGLSYLLQHGIGNPEQLAFVGHSFGGFSTLTALAFEPSRFKVGFAGAAPADLVKSIQHYTHEAEGLVAQRRKSGFKTLMVDLADPVDRERLYKQSPDHAWQQIVRPLYLWAGEQDDRVAIEDVRDMALRLRDAGKPVSFMSAPTEGHSPNSDLAKEAYWYLLERALARHLPGRWQRQLSPALSRYMDKHLMFDQAEAAAEMQRAPQV